MLADKLLEQINQVAEAYAHAQTCRALAHAADLDSDRANLTARAEYWDRQVGQLWANLTAAVNTALPPTLYAGPDPIAPVRVPDHHRVEVRGSLGNGRAVVVRFTGAQAVAVAAAMIASAALGAAHLGDATAILPPVPPTPPGPPVRT